MITFITVLLSCATGRRRRPPAIDGLPRLHLRLPPPVHEDVIMKQAGSCVPRDLHVPVEGVPLSQGVRTQGCGLHRSLRSPGYDPLLTNTCHSGPEYALGRCGRVRNSTRDTTVRGAVYPHAPYARRSGLYHTVYHPALGSVVRSVSYVQLLPFLCCCWFIKGKNNGLRPGPLQRTSAKSSSSYPYDKMRPV